MPVPLLVFLHGLGQTPQSWQDQVTALPSGTRAVAPWLEGCRPGASGRFEVPKAADAVLAQLNRFGVDQVALCGSGLGAVVAVEAALRSPEAVSHLAVFGGVIHTPRWAATLQKATMKAMPAARFAEAGIDRTRLTELLDALAGVDFRHRLGGVRARTLVVRGERDAAGAAAAQGFASGIPGARLSVVPGAGALVNLDAPTAFNEALYGFLDDSEG